MMRSRRCDDSGPCTTAIDPLEGGSPLPPLSSPVVSEMPNGVTGVTPSKGLLLGELFPRERQSYL